MVCKNETGVLGKICNNCGGYGFTNNLQGQSSGCIQCNQTGVEKPSVDDLQNQVNELKSIIANMKYGSDDS